MPVFLEFFNEKRKGLLLEGYKYSCIMAMVPEEVNPSIERYQSIIEPEDICHDEDCKGLEDEFHVTILYGILDSNPERAKALVKEQRIFSLKLGKISVFDNPKYDVLKVDVHSDALVGLNKLITKNMEYQSDYPDYHPHLTIAYLRKGCGERYTGKFLEGVEMTVDTLQFSSSSGVKTDIKLIE